jgi:hypothetical protein
MLQLFGKKFEKILGSEKNLMGTKFCVKANIFMVLQIKLLVCKKYVKYGREVFPDAQALSTVDDLKFCGVIANDCMMKLSLVDADTGRHVSEISDAAETTAQVTPNWLDLRNTEQYRLHESKDVEGHLLGGESANSLCRLSNKVNLS